MKINVMESNCENFDFGSERYDPILWMETYLCSSNHYILVVNYLSFAICELQSQQMWPQKHNPLHKIIPMMNDMPYVSDGKYALRQIELTLYQNRNYNKLTHFSPCDHWLWLTQTIAWHYHLFAHCFMIRFFGL